MDEFDQFLEHFPFLKSAQQEFPNISKKKIVEELKYYCSQNGSIEPNIAYDKLKKADNKEKILNEYCGNDEEKRQTVEDMFPNDEDGSEIEDYFDKL